MPNSLRKHIRREKARIRRAVTDPVKQKELILELRQKLVKEAKDTPLIKEEVKKEGE